MFAIDGALQRIPRGSRILICPHDDPDPDALAAAWGLGQLLEQTRGATWTVGFEGIIGRAENRAMVRELGIPLRRLDSLDVSVFDGMAIVDTQPKAQNHSAPTQLPTWICIDHHPRLPEEAPPPWFDVRPDAESTSAIVLQYLTAAGIEPGEALSTAILYALKTDTRDLSRDANAEDLAAHAYVFPRADQRALGAIVHPRLDPLYFQQLHDAMEVARVHGSAVQVCLGQMSYPDLVAEAADLFVRRRGTDWCLAGGLFDGWLRFSLRTELHEGSAGRVARKLVSSRCGSAGGHGMSAGGRIALADGTQLHPDSGLWLDLVADYLALVDAPATGDHLWSRGR